ncbi:hypothetical protein BDW42DRAFT_160136 [Aspergillus taichungensis]|uniref:Ankyrin repeat-containing domain protein n=1 Tax=Aspergillus taichungensis TaxID=482145 RepID=A0A2J5I785_9EURO|nr:hypothetical protein BDW42DRAFT_160136 [Aspergillus taichungensis]
MMEVIQLDRVEFLSLLLSHGFLIKPSFARKATVCRAKRILECFLGAGWDMNEPVDVLIPPVLCYAVTDADMTSWFLEHGANPNTRCEASFFSMPFVETRGLKMSFDCLSKEVPL